MQAITIKQLYVESKGIKILQVEDFNINPGTICYIDGHSGSGKSIFLKALIRLLPIHYKQYSINSSDVNTFPPEELRKKIMYLNQQPMLPLGRVKDFISRVSTFSCHKPDEKKIEAKFVSLLQLLERDHTFLNFDNANLSGGEIQILQLCLALSLCKDTLILDEAFSAMDRNTHYKAEGLVNNWINEDIKSRSIIFTSHQPEISLLKATSSYFMSRGILKKQS